MKKSGLTLRKNPVAMTLISLATLADGWISISGRGAKASPLGLAIGFLIPAAITFLLLWGIASSLIARKEGSVHELQTAHAHSDALSRIAQ